MKKLAFVTLACCLFACHTLSSASPMIKVGEMQILTLIDVASTSDAVAEKMPIVGMSQHEVDKLVPSGKINSQILAFLVEKDGKKYLFDTGLPLANSGGVVAALKGMNLTPADIDVVVFTHAHYDHIGGMVDENNEIVYRNADHYISAPEYLWWTEEVKRHFYSGDEQANAMVRSNHEAAVKNFGALEKLGKKPILFKFDEEVFPGITALDARGHTPGHTAFKLESAGKSILIVGDIVHVSEVQLPRPEITVVYDTNQDEARDARLKFLQIAAETGVPVAGMHLPVPGIWKVEKDGSGYRIIKPQL